MQKRSCHDRLAQLRKEFGITEEEEEEAVRQRLDPTERLKSPDVVIHLAREKEPKWLRKARKKEKKRLSAAERQARYDVAYWFLEVFATRKFADKIYGSYDPDHFEDMVDWVYEYAQSWAKFMTKPKHTELTEEEMLDRLTERVAEDERSMDIAGLKFQPIDKAYSHLKERAKDDLEIPDRYWNEYVAWAEDHPIKHYRDIDRRRLKFLSRTDKKGKHFRKHMLLLDPYTGMSMMSEKKMVKHLDRIMKENQKRTAEFKKFLEDLVSKGQMSDDLMRNFLYRSEEAIERTKDRFEDAREAAREWEKMKKREAKRREDYERRRKEWFEAFGSDTDFPETQVELSFK